MTSANTMVKMTRVAGLSRSSSICTRSANPSVGRRIKNASQAPNAAPFASRKKLRTSEIVRFVLGLVVQSENVTV
jgi:hypothetical protein